MQLRRAGIRASWVRPESMHLTLRFLGEIDEDQANAAGGMLARECRGTPPFACAVEARAPSQSASTGRHLGRSRSLDGPCGDSGHRGTGGRKHRPQTRETAVSAHLTLGGFDGQTRRAA